MRTKPSMSLGASIRRARLGKGYSLEGLARRAGCARSYISQIENAKVSPPSDGVLTGLERALGLPEGHLLDMAAEARTPRRVLERLRRVEARVEARVESRSGERVRLPGEVLSGSGTGVAPGGATGVAPGGMTGCGAGSSREGQSVPGSSAGRSFATDLDEAWRDGRLRSLAGSDVEPARVSRAPILNRVQAGCLRDFEDLPSDGYAPCPWTGDPQAFGARVVGASMSPTYIEGDLVVFSPMADVSDGCDCFVQLVSGETTFKRVSFEDEGVVLTPLNPSFPTRVVSRDDVHLLAAALSVTRAVMA